MKGQSVWDVTGLHGVRLSAGVSAVADVVELAVFCSTGCGPGYDTVFSVVIMCSVQRSDAGCKSPLSS